MNTFIASNEISLCYSPANTKSRLLTSKYESHCKQTCSSLATNAFCAGDEHFWCWRRLHFMLEMNTLALETNVLETCVRASATHTASYQWLPSRLYVKMIATVTATYNMYLRNGCSHVGDVQKVSTCRCTITSLVALTWSSMPTKQRKL